MCTVSVARRNKEKAAHAFSAVQLGFTQRKLNIFPGDLSSSLDMKNVSMKNLSMKYVSMKNVSMQNVSMKNVFMKNVSMKNVSMFP